MSNSSSRNSTYSIMNHQSFGELVINKGGKRVTIPPSLIDIHTGYVDSKIQACIQDLNDHDNLCKLAIRGVQVV